MNVLWLAEHAAQVVVDGIWQGTLVAVVVAAGLRVLPRISAAQRFAVWVLAFGMALAVPLLPSARALEGAAKPVRVDSGWGLALAGLWAATFAVRALRLGLQARRVRRIWLAAEPVEAGAAVAALLDRCRRKPLLCASTEVDAPCVIGFFAPRLLVPAAMLRDITEAELQHIALHECEHLRRYDDWLNLLQKVALAAFPLNPALLWVDRRLGLERELACDAGVVAATGAALDYASCLARLAERRLGGGRVALALSAWARRSELARRVYTLLEPVRGVSPLAKMGARMALGAMACVLLAAADGMVHAPALVSFSPAAQPVVAMGAVARPAFAEVPVWFHADAGQPRMTLVSAVTRSATPARRAMPVRSATRRVRQSGARQAPLVFNTVARRRMVPAYAVPVRFSYTYAAVPFADGWLIVQL